MNTEEARTETDGESGAEAEVSSPMALGILGGLIVIIGGYIALTSALGIKEMWAAFLFLLYWAGIQHMDFEQLPGSVLGAFFGLLLVTLAHHAGAWLGIGEWGMLVFLAVLLGVIYCLIRGHFAIVINLAAMLYLTVGTIPAIEHNSSVAGMAAALAIGIVYFVGIVWGGRKLMALRQNAAA